MQVEVLVLIKTVLFTIQKMAKRKRSTKKLSRTKKAKAYLVNTSTKKKKKRRRRNGDGQLPRTLPGRGSFAFENELARTYRKGYGTRERGLPTGLVKQQQRPNKRRRTRRTKNNRDERKHPDDNKEDDDDDDDDDDKEGQEAALMAKFDCEIRPLKTTKDKIKQPELSEANIIPHINDCILMNGRTGAGKTTLLANLLTRKEFFKNKFDRIFLVSPTGLTDDIQKDLKLDEGDIVNDPDDAPEFIEILMSSQEEQIGKLGAHKAPKYCLIYDDCIGYRDLLNDETVQKSFYACRHYNLTTFMLTQSFTKVPRACRLQARSIFYFAGSNSEADLMADEFSPPGYNRKMFKRMLASATPGYDFLHIQLREPEERRFRHNLGEIIPVMTSDEAEQLGENHISFGQQGENGNMGQQPVSNVRDPRAAANSHQPLGRRRGGGNSASRQTK
jgi:hypothetical protein